MFTMVRSSREVKDRSEPGALWPGQDKWQWDQLPGGQATAENGHQRVDRSWPHPQPHHACVEIRSMESKFSVDLL